MPIIWNPDLAPNGLDIGHIPYDPATSSTYLELLPIMKNHSHKPTRLLRHAHA